MSFKKKERIPNQDKSSYKRIEMDQTIRDAITEENYIPLNSLERELVVVDVGCRWGFASKFLKEEKIKIYGFDPDQSECIRLEKEYASEKIKVYPIGLSDTEGTRILYLTQEPACSSLYKPDSLLTEHMPALACAREMGSTLIETTTLSDWAKREGLSNIDYIKLDTQGSELEILKGAEDLLSTIRALEIEVEFNPIYLGQPLFYDVDHYLRSKGFVLWRLSNLVHYSELKEPSNSIAGDMIHYDVYHCVDAPVYSGQLYWANAHYIKSDSINPPKIDHAQAKRDIVLFNLIGLPDAAARVKYMQLLKDKFLCL